MGLAISPDILRIGTVTEVDLASACVRVAVGEIETHLIPWGTARAGGLRIWSPPSEGEQVILLMPDGDWEAAFVIGSLFSDHRPPPDDSEKTILLFDDGARFSYDPISHIFDVDLSEAEGSAAVTVPGGLRIEGDVAIIGDVSIQGDTSMDGDNDVTGTVTADQDVLASDISLKSHKHGLVKSGPNTSGKPQ